MASGELRDIDAGPGEQAEISLAQAAAELARRQRAQSGLVDYARSIDIPGAPLIDDEDPASILAPVETEMARHHIVILRAIEKCVTGKNGRLMIFAPFGSAKSTYASVVAPAWVMSKWPNQELIVTGYGDKLPLKHSRRIRQVVDSEKSRSIWDDQPRLKADNRAVDQWAMTNGSSLLAAGILSGITGNRANGIIIDDPVKGRQEADSQTIRDRVEEEYRDTLKTRLKPGGWIVLIQTRWHEDDLSGRILPDNYDGRSGPVRCKDGQVWEILNIQAKCERRDDPVGRQLGEYLWPEWFPAAHWEAFENDPRGQRTWNALCQQRPTAGDGVEFKREWFKWYDPDLEPGQLVPMNSPPARPKALRFYGATDYATKEDRKADFSEHGVAGMDPSGNLWFTDWWYGQKTTDITIAQWIFLLRRWRPPRWAHEGGPIGHAVTPAMNRAMREGKAYTVLTPMPSIESKTIKLASFQARAAAGTVWLPLKRPWATRLVDQLCAFPAGRHDDAADVAGLIGRLIDEMATLTVPSPAQRHAMQPFTVEWLEHEDNNERKLRFS